MSDSPAPARPPRSTTNYVEPAELAALVRESRRRRRPTEALALALVRIAAGVWERYRFVADQDEFVQEVVVHFLGGPLRNADPRKNLFAYFTTCAIRFGLKLRGKAAGDRRKFEEHAARLVEEGTQIPTRQEFYGSITRDEVSESELSLTTPRPRARKPGEPKWRPRVNPA
ncbi:MAG TPA: hypothetical protein VH092_37785 [Urbifossiella sp.]|jgi:hypothetical protein|nr:hypothetical protein [Urbifossiella sp.]